MRMARDTCVSIPSKYLREAIELCFGEEIEEVARTMREAFGQADPASQGTLTRHEFRSCLMSKMDRLSFQEVQMLMQMCREDEQGNVPRPKTEMIYIEEDM